MSNLPVFQVGQGDTQPTLTDTLLNPISRSPQDLTGAAVRFVARPTVGGEVVINAPAQVVYAAGGLVQYPWTLEDTAAPGNLAGEWHVTLPGGASETWPLHTWAHIRVEAALSSPTASPDPAPLLPTPWISADDVAARPRMARVDRRVLQQCAEAASEVLYLRSGRLYPGLLTATMRPSADPLPGRIGAGLGTFASCYGYASGDVWTALTPDRVYDRRGGGGWPPAVDLGVYPLRSIVQVLLDGQIIPPAEYRIDEQRWLVRVRPTATAVPTRRYGWPSHQQLDLPPTEPGTFAVTCTYGTAPPAMGKLAAAALAASIAQLLGYPATGATLPARATAVKRAGVTVEVANQALDADGGVGVPEAELFLGTVNPDRLRRMPTVWTPDLGSTRRSGG
ncbi:MULTISPECIES: hypothetical protein [Frankia]|uniref:Uncharacterized protein n=1 Tax=Frankia alni (strain DSM 45986 / CECT 9034 / ACN14a) TaxID=326424 RepID=Q0RMC9_FRAAA|nr:MULTISPECIES: hypothetical protein [Frankia]CAJ61322.1 hypothetical protein FRAAL2676 [Frankia alni ACN14a]